MTTTPPQTPHALLHPFAVPAKPESDFINIVSSDRCTLTDDTGKTYLDGMASLWYCQVGHGRREIIDAVADQLNGSGTYHIFSPFTSDIARTAAEKIVERSPHPDGRVMLGCSGSEAVDSALKIARLVQQRRGNTEKQILVRRTHGYHGTNFGGTAAQGLPANRVGWGDLDPNFIEVAADDTEALSTLFAEHGDRIAGIISEPVQGAGGIFPPADGYLQEMRRLCDVHGTLLIFDEVITGFGRTGSWFASQTYDVTPDLITFAKGATSGYQPLSGVVVSRAVAAELEADEEFLLRHGYTYAGHAGSCAAAVANIEIIDREGLVERANHIGAEISNGLSALAADNLIDGFRGVGAMWAADMGQDTLAMGAELLNKGIVCRGFANAIMMCPPLIITDDEIARFIEAISELRK